jgi:RimJ/RimL family protein N-acetyltransferase
MLELHPFLPDDWIHPAGWVSNQDELTQFAGTEFQYPLDGQQIADFLNWPNHEVFKASWEGKVVGMAEVIYVGDKAARIGRVIIGETAMRGLGLGGQLMTKLVEYIRTSLHRPTVRLYVFRGNTGAVRCYEKVGFVFTGQNSIEVKPGNEDWRALEMEWQGAPAN